MAKRPRLRLPVANMPKRIGVGGAEVVKGSVQTRGVGLMGLHGSIGASHQAGDQECDCGAGTFVEVLTANELRLSEPSLAVVRLMLAADARAEEWRWALGRLRADRDTHATELIHLFDQDPEISYDLRIALVLTATCTYSTKSVSLLRRLGLRATQRAGQSSDCATGQGDDELMALLAVQCLSVLLSGESTRRHAIECLLDLLHAGAPVRREACAVISSLASEASADARTRLGSEAHLLGVRTVHPSSIRLSYPMSDHLKRSIAS